jgi:hypothetical protein
MDRDLDVTAHQFANDHLAEIAGLKHADERGRR